MDANSGITLPKQSSLLEYKFLHILCLFCDLIFQKDKLDTFSYKDFKLKTLVKLFSPSIL